MIDQKEKRDALKAKRDLLFERLLENPQDTPLALEIKIIDDQVAECTREIERKKQKRI